MLNIVKYFVALVVASLGRAAAIDDIFLRRHSSETNQSAAVNSLNSSSSFSIAQNQTLGNTRGDIDSFKVKATSRYSRTKVLAEPNGLHEQDNQVDSELPSISPAKPSFQPSQSFSPSTASTAKPLSYPTFVTADLGPLSSRPTRELASNDFISAPRIDNTPVLVVPTPSPSEDAVTSPDQVSTPPSTSITVNTSDFAFYISLSLPNIDTRMDSGAIAIFETTTRAFITNRLPSIAGVAVGMSFISVIGQLVIDSVGLQVDAVVQGSIGLDSSVTSLSRISVQNTITSTSFANTEALLRDLANASSFFAPTQESAVDDRGSDLSSAKGPAAPNDTDVTRRMVLGGTTAGLVMAALLFVLGIFVARRRYRDASKSSNPMDASDSGSGDVYVNETHTIAQRCPTQKSDCRADNTSLAASDPASSLSSMSDFFYENAGFGKKSMRFPTTQYPVQQCRKSKDYDAWSDQASSISGMSDLFLYDNWSIFSGVQSQPEESDCSVGFSGQTKLEDSSSANKKGHEESTLGILTVESLDKFESKLRVPSPLPVGEMESQQDETSFYGDNKSSFGYF